MKSVKSAFLQALGGVRFFGVAMTLLTTGPILASEPAHLSAAPDLTKPPAPSSAVTVNQTEPSPDKPVTSGHTDWSRGDLFGIGSLWGSSADFVRPNSKEPSPPVLDYRAQKKLWEQMDQRRHWMFGNSPGENGPNSPGDNRETKEFVPKSGLPQSVLQKRAMEEILHPSTRMDGSTKNRSDGDGNPNSSDPTDAGRGFLDSQSGRGSLDRGTRDSWALRNATESRSWLDLDRRAPSSLSDFGQNAATAFVKDARDRTRRFDEMFGSTAATAATVVVERDPRGWSTSSDGFVSQRERLDRLFDSSTPAAASGNPLPGSGGTPNLLGQAQRNELFGDGKSAASPSARRSKAFDDSTRRPTFQPQPGELPLPKPNGN